MHARSLGSEQAEWVSACRARAAMASRACHAFMLRRYTDFATEEDAAKNVPLRSGIAATEEQALRCACVQHQSRAANDRCAREISLEESYRFNKTFAASFFLR